MICPYCGNLVSYNSYFNVFHCPKCGGFFKQAIVMKRNECDDLNKPLTLDDAIAHLDDTLSDTGRKWSCESCRMEHVQLRAWLAELREIKQERNTPLTLDELRQMDGEPVWVEFQDGSDGCWGLVHITVFNHVVLANGLYCTVDKPYYGKTWLAYRQKPKEETL